MAKSPDDSRSRLGRGLAALMGDVAEAPKTAPAAAREMPRKVPIEFITPNPNNPRRLYSEDELKELAQSIKERGIIQPIVVRAKRGAKNVYEIIAGERRWRASQKAGLHEVPIVLLDVTDEESLELAIIENVQRTDLNPLEEAGGYQALASQYKHSQEDIAQIVGKSRSHVTNTLRLLKLPDKVKDYINSGKLSAGHARSLVGQADPEAMARDIVERGLNVRQAEQLRQAQTKGKKGKAARTKVKADADTIALEKRLSDSLGLTVSIDHKGRAGGSVKVKYKTLEQLDEVTRRLGRGR